MMFDKSVAICTEDIEDVSFGTVCSLDCSKGLTIVPVNSEEEFEVSYRELNKHFFTINNFTNLDIRLIDEYSTTIFGHNKPKYSFYIIPSHICLRHFNNSKEVNNKNNFIDLPIEDVYDNFDINLFYHEEIYSKLYFINLVNPNFFIPYSYELSDWFEFLPNLIVPNKSKFLNSMDYQMMYVKLLKGMGNFCNSIFNCFVDFLMDKGFRMKYKECLPPNEQESLKSKLREINSSCKSLCIF